jgi:hypothetical protein
MEGLYQELEAYSWSTDEEFQAGLSNLVERLPPTSVENVILRAKVYFYGKKIGQQLDFDEYKRWSDNRTVTLREESQGDDDEVKEKSYDEIVELILAGKPVPGTREIPDTVLGEGASSEPKAEVRRKPWERA